MPEKVYHGRCLDCGDEWDEREYNGQGGIDICPECHSRNVIEVPPDEDSP